MSPVLVPPGFTTRTWDQRLPFQWSTSLSSLPLGDGLPKSPTAQQFADETHVTSNSWLSRPGLEPPGFGVRTTDHFLPFQCSTWFFSMSLW